ncbi:MAG TPA: glycosyltransferase [Flavisolibacter sp.]|nr:glycosyltransferase [Flavisolibacter sp.]
MDRIPSSPPVIAPVDETVARPLWSVMIPVYNCAAFLPEALQSVLAQEMGESLMQIEVVDDASTDTDVQALVEEIGKGRIQYYRQAENVGSLRNFETCLNHSIGKLIHLLHGDDRVRPGFYQKMAGLFETYPQAGAAICRYAFINTAGKETHLPVLEAKEDGILSNWLLRIAERQRTQYAATVVRRTVYEKLGSFYGMTYGEDWEMWVRIARDYPVVYTPEILAEYRVHHSSISSEKVMDGRVTADYLNAIEFIQQHLPERERKRLRSKSIKDCAFFNINKAYRCWDVLNDKAAAHQQVQQALATSKHPAIVYHAMKIYVKTTVGLQQKRSKSIG